MSDPRYGAGSGLRLELPGGSLVAALAEVNEVLAAEGARVEPLDLGGVPDDVARLIAQREFCDAERERLLGGPVRGACRRPTFPTVVAIRLPPRRCSCLSHVLYLEP